MGGSRKTSHSGLSEVEIIQKRGANMETVPNKSTRWIAARSKARKSSARRRSLRASEIPDIGPPRGVAIVYSVAEKQGSLWPTVYSRLGGFQNGIFWVGEAVAIRPEKAKSTELPYRFATACGCDCGAPVHPTDCVRISILRRPVSLIEGRTAVAPGDGLVVYGRGLQNQGIGEVKAS